MKKIAQMFAITLVAATAILAANNPMVGGHEMFPSKNIVQNALNSDDHTTLVAAVKAWSVRIWGRSRRPWDP